MRTTSAGGYRSGYCGWAGLLVLAACSSGSSMSEAGSEVPDLLPTSDAAAADGGETPDAAIVSDAEDTSEVTESSVSDVVAPADGTRSAGFDVLVADQAIRVELTWTTPGDPDEQDEGVAVGTDLDLHIAHGTAATGSGFDGDGDGADDVWFHDPFDCYWFNPTPNWGSSDPAAKDDPAMLRDDADGAGPEVIAFGHPEGATYHVGVHFSQDNGFGGVLATLRIYLNGFVVAEHIDVQLTELDMWDAARVEWPSGKVTLVEAEGGGHQITANYKSPSL